MSKKSSKFVSIAALLLTIISFTVVAGWIFKVAMLVQLRTVWVPMQFNTAICFFFCAAGLTCLEFDKLKSASAFSAIVLTVAGVTLSEFIFGFNCGLDTCIIKHPFVTTATSHIGRMSPLTTIAFILNGTALLLGANCHRIKLALPFSAFLALTAGVLSGMSVIGYFIGVQSVYGLTGFTFMAIHTGVSTLLVSAGLWGWLWINGVRNYNLTSWFLLPMSVFMIILVGLFSQYILHQRDTAATWRKHTYDVLLQLDAVKFSLRGLQVLAGTNMSFAVVGEKNPFQKSEIEYSGQVKILEQLISDNATQVDAVHRLQAIQANVHAWYTERANQVQNYNMTEAKQIASTRHGDELINQMSFIVEKMGYEERRLLIIREETAQRLSYDSALIVTLGSILATILVLTSCLWLLRSLREREAVETALRQVKESLETANATLLQSLTQKDSLLNEIRKTELERDNFFTISLDIMCIAGTDGYFKKVNPAVTTTLGYSPEEFTVKSFLDFVHPDDRANTIAEAGKLSTGTNTYHFENRYLCKNGAYKWLSWSAVPSSSDGLLYCAARDISIQKEADEQLRASLAEKETLLREIHHRVKNNLQIVSSLLSLQSQNVSDPVMKAMLAESRNRLETMSLIHELLYKDTALATVNFEQYVRKLVNHLRTSFVGGARSIDFILNIPAVGLPIDIAIPCGLIVNELVSNSLKYAFPFNCHGIIKVEMTMGSNDRQTMKVSDNGAGFPAEFDFRKSKSLGLKLVHALARQINGTLERIPTDVGTCFLVSFGSENSI